MKNLKNILDSGKTALGIFAACSGTAPVELAAGCGYDFVILDGEHGQADERGIFEQIARLEKYRTAALVRIPALRHEYVKRMLDYGADGILCPMIESAAQAEEFSRSLRYPPAGTRGMTGIFRASDYNNDFDGYFRNSGDVFAAVQIESVKAVENVEAIAAVPGIDMLFIGHSDLSVDYGCYKDFADPRIIAAEKRIIAAAGANGKAVGIVLRNNMDLRAYAEKGVKFICLGTDLGIMQQALREKLQTYRNNCI